MAVWMAAMASCVVAAASPAVAGSVRMHLDLRFSPPHSSGARLVGRLRSASGVDGQADARGRLPAATTRRREAAAAALQSGSSPDFSSTPESGRTESPSASVPPPNAQSCSLEGESCQSGRPRKPTGARRGRGWQFRGFEMLQLRRPIWLDREWVIRAVWRPCDIAMLRLNTSTGSSSTEEGPPLQTAPDDDWSSTPQTASSQPGCRYPPDQRVLAFLKSADGLQGLLLLTSWGEVGVFDGGKLISAPFAWQRVCDGKWHELVAVGRNGRTAFFADGAKVAEVMAQPQQLFVGRVGGDSDAKNHQAVGNLRRLQIISNTSEISFVSARRFL
ncbi:unnamed protein product [Polarella glacialis]|uniref:Laminin G domain-containing protein n=1 Tax=Polarella glacialis TaxID=89957 RepID=A0A813GJM9_POLGL|nr:unnamed protein product [Polarella glacialis]